MPTPHLPYPSSVAAAVVTVLLVTTGAGCRRPDSQAAPVAAAQETPAFPNDVGALSVEQNREVGLRSHASMLFVFFHELGHALIHELKLPAIGPEEDVADEFAAFMVTSRLQSTFETNKDLAAELAYSGAVYWKIQGALKDSQATDNTWSDEHSPDLRRYYNVLCIAVGADPVRFVMRAAADGVPQARLNRCADEFKTKQAAWDTLLAKHRPGNVGRSLDAIRELSGKTVTSALTLHVGPVGKDAWKPFELAHTGGNFLQRVLDGVSRDFVLPRPIGVHVKSCGAVNAFYSADDNTITMCHELFQEVTNGFAAAVLGRDDTPAGGARPASGAVDADFRLVNRSTMTINALFVSSVTQDKWGEDRLPELVGPGATFVVRMPDADGCEYDLRVEYDDTRIEEQRTLNLCELEDVPFSGANARAAEAPAPGAGSPGAGARLTQTFVHPNGLFTVGVPDGWKVAHDATSLTLTRSGSLIGIEVSTLSPLEAVNGFVAQIVESSTKGRWRSLVGHDTPPESRLVAGRPGLMQRMQAHRRDDVHLRLALSAAPSDDGGSLALTVIVPESDLEAVQDDVEASLASVQLGRPAPRP